MEIPISFQLGGIVWKVIQIPNFSLLGECQRDERTIHLRENMPDDVKEQTFCHELVHAIKFTMASPEPHDEQEVDLFATFLHQFMTSFEMEPDDNSLD